MRYDAELRFFLNLLNGIDVPVRIFPVSDRQDAHLERDIYSLITPNLSHTEIYETLVRACEPACIHHLYDTLLCNYLYFKLPETEEPSYVLIGPYTYARISREEILSIAERLSLPPSLYPAVRTFYTNLAYLHDTTYLTAILNTFGVVLWGSLDAFTIKTQDSSGDALFPFSAEEIVPDAPVDPSTTVKILEQNYQREAELMQAVSLGQTHTAEMIIKDFTITRLEQRTPDSIRNVKNYSFVINTLLRKAAEKGGVHPLHIDRLSSRYAIEIERLTSLDGALKLHQEMIHKYCLLVKNHSLHSYSPFIKKVITNVDADLTADLTLKAQANLLNINASYLSSLFKKEMGMTLTEYVNRHRINHAVALLNTTNMQIQLIAQYCGIPDVNYFTKMFKKYIGKTPQEYRKNISISIRDI